MNTPLERNAQATFAPMLECLLKPDAGLEKRKVREQERIICDVMNAATNGFAVLDLPLKLRALVGAIIAAVLHEDNVTTSEGGKTVVTASYKTLVGLLFKDGQERSRQAKISEVRRLVNNLDEWQHDENHPTLCTITRGDRMKTGVDEKGQPIYEFLDTQFELVFLDAIAKAMLRCTDPRRMRGTVQATLAEMMKLPPSRNFIDRREPELSDLQKRDENTAMTKALKAAEKEQGLHGDPLRYLESFAQKLLEKGREHFSPEAVTLRASRPVTPGEENGKFTPAEARKIREAKGGGCVENDIPPTPQVEHPQPDNFFRYGVKQHVEDENSIVEDQKNDAKSETHPPTGEANARAGDTELPSTSAAAAGGCVTSSASFPLLDDALSALDCFERVGVKSFDVNFLREFAAESEIAEKWKTLTPDEFRDALPDLLKRNETKKQSLDVRITDPRVLQIDDSDLDEAIRLHSFSIITFSTSPGSYQCWLMFPSTRERDEAKLRLLPNLKGNGGSGGKMRFPGSLNCKLKHQRDDGIFPRITLDSTFAVVTSIQELEAAHLLAPRLAAQKPSTTATASGQKCRQMPERERYLKSKPDGSEDRSNTDYAWMLACLRRCFSIDEVAAVAVRISERCQKRGIDRTREEVSKAERKVTVTPSNFKQINKEN